MNLAAVALTQSQAAVVAGTATINTGAAEINLIIPNNNFNAINFTNDGQNISVRDINAIDIAGISMTGNTDLSITAGGNITDSGAIVTGSGTTTIQTTDGSLTLNNQNDFTGVVIADSTGDISLVDVNTIETGSIAPTVLLTQFRFLPTTSILALILVGLQAMTMQRLVQPMPLKVTSGDPVAVVSDVGVNMSLTTLF